MATLVVHDVPDELYRRSKSVPAPPAAPSTTRCYRSSRTLWHQLATLARRQRSSTISVVVEKETRCRPADLTVWNSCARTDRVTRRTRSLRWPRSSSIPDTPDVQPCRARTSRQHHAVTRRPRSVTAGSPFRCVVDASAAIKIVLAEPLSAQANRLFARIAETPPAQFHVPDLFFVECANILWKYIRRRAYPQQRARFDLRYLVGLGLDTTPHRRLGRAGVAIGSDLQLERLRRLLRGAGAAPTGAAGHGRRGDGAEAGRRPGRRALAGRPTR